MKIKKTETALITGGASGIGFEFAKILKEKGYNLILVSRDKNKLEQVRKTLDPENLTTITLICENLSERGAAAKLYSECKRQNLEVDVSVNNAGFGVFGEHVELASHKINEMIMLNINTLTELCSLFGKEISQRKSGYILNVASTAAYQPMPFLAAYAAGLLSSETSLKL